MASFLHLRTEKYPKGLRALITPDTCRTLVQKGITVVVERSEVRLFKDDDYAAAGATLVESNSWIDAPSYHIIVGTKELPDADFELRHTHIYWAHAYLGQPGWAKTLTRYARGGGTLLDIEYVWDKDQRPVIWFGYHAGFASMAVAIKGWSHLMRATDRHVPAVRPYANVEEMIKDTKLSLMTGTARFGRQPKVLVIGAYGKSGRGAVGCLLQSGLNSENITQWGRQDTSNRGPMPEILNYDILVNCILLTDPIKPFLLPETLDSPERKLSMICDVSCDLGRTGNPLPIYTEGTTLEQPVIDIPVKQGPPLAITAIAYTPSLLPRESSVATAEALLPAISKLPAWRTAGIWQPARSVFHRKLAEAQDLAPTARL